MRISTKSRLAVDALVDLGLRAVHGPVALSSVGAKLQVSLSYLEQLFSRLRREGLVDSTRGPGGGYALARAAPSIAIADIVRAVDGAGVDPHAGRSSALWQRAHERALDYLHSVSLQQLIDEHGGQAPPPQPRRTLPPRPAPAKPDVHVPNSVFALGSSLRPRADP